MSIKAIPTMYAGVQFRSRLEARWAALFDLVGWKWEYEPLDLDGYIPDFLICPPRIPVLDRCDRDDHADCECHGGGIVRTGLTSSHVLIEVKPILNWDVDDESEDYKRLHSAIRKIEESGWKDDCMVVGAALVPFVETSINSFHGAADSLGVWAGIDREHHDLLQAMKLGQCRRCPKFYLIEETSHLQDWEQCNRTVGCDCCDSDKAYAHPIDPGKLWREAGNRVQWRSPR